MALAPYVPLVQAPELITLKFRLQYTSGGEADFQVPAYSIASNTWTSTGLYTLTLNEKYPVFIGGFASVMGPTEANDSKVVIDPDDYAPTTGVLTYRVMDDDGDGTPALADVPDNEWVYFELTFCRRSGLAPTGALT
jgi:hypothetical protein